MVKIIAVTSGKGGCGKSTFSIEISLALLKQGKKVLLIDMDEGMRCLDMLLGVSEKLVFDVSDAVLGKELDSCILKTEKYRGLSLLAAPDRQGLVDFNAFGRFIRAIPEEQFDTVVIDLAAGSNKELYMSLPTDTDFICICNPNQVSVRDAANIGNLLAEIGRRGRLVINRFERYFVQNSVFSSIDDIIDETGLALLGIVPESEKLKAAFLSGKFPTRGHDFKAFCRIASRLCDKDIRLPKLKKI